MKGFCELCKKETEVVKSHIVPKFVFDWIKKTSATGYMRSPENPNKRLQDGVKDYLLCRTCEILISEYETYFSREIYYPYLNEKRHYFEYNELLMKFIVSVSWRVANNNLRKFSKNSVMEKYAHEAEEYWRKIILEDELDKKYEHRIYFLDYIENGPRSLPKKINDYIMRSVDATIASNSERIFIYSKFPGIIIISLIQPQSSERNDGSKIAFKGKINLPCTYYFENGLYEFLISRASIIDNKPLSGRSLQKVVSDMLKNPDRVLNSKSYQAFLETQSWKMKKRSSK
ncbi:MAG: hypothetical protein JW716_04450 [Candidatus Aenigmarchaeota archaeon]|nr:hypothetical protein [Candidatus Aenigmarchaeota archaeon]